MTDATVSLGEAVSGAYEAALEALDSPQAESDNRAVLNVRIAAARLGDAQPPPPDSPTELREAYALARRSLSDASNALQSALEGLAVLIAHTEWGDW